MQYETSDLPLIAYLLCVGEPIVEVSRRESKVFFTFSTEGTDIPALTELFYGGKTLVDPFKYFMELKRAKMIIFQTP